MDTALLEEVVGLLNGSLYNDELTLISMTEYMQKPRHCFKMLNKILELICGTKPVNMESASIDDIIEILLGIVWRLRYKPETSSDTFIENFQSEDTATFLHLYQFLLTNVDVLKQRYYVSQFLMPPNIPSEHVMDPTIQRLTEELRGYQERFKEVHMKYLDAEEVQKNSDIMVISNEIGKLTLQRDQLANQVEALSAKLSSTPEAKECVEMATKIRKTLHKTEELKQQITDQRNIIAYAEARTKTLLETSEKTKGMKITSAEDAKVFLDMLQRENRELRTEVEVKLPTEIEAKKEIIAICKQTCVSDKEREDALNAVTQKVENTTNEIKDLENKIESLKNSNSSEGDTVTTLNETLNELKQKRTTVDEHKVKLLAQQKQLEDKLASLLGSQTESVAEALTTGKTSSAALKRALHSYKTLSDKLRPLRNKINISQRETTIAKRTAEILSQYVDNNNNNNNGGSDNNSGINDVKNNNSTTSTIISSSSTITTTTNNNNNNENNKNKNNIGNSNNNSTGDPSLMYVPNNSKSQGGMESKSRSNSNSNNGDDKHNLRSSDSNKAQFGGPMDNEANQLKEAKSILLETEAELRERRASLEPQLHKLTALRTQIVDSENALRETELKMEQLAAGNEGEEFRITRDHNEMEKAVEALTTELETIMCQNNILQARIDFASNSNESASTYQQLRDLLSVYNQNIKQEIEEGKKLQKDHEYRRRQKKMFEDLAILLQTRIDVLRTRSNEPGGVGLHTTHGNDGTDVLTNPMW